jgi:magnesium transporter
VVELHRFRAGAIMVGKILIPEIKMLIERRDFAALRELFADWVPADVAEVITDLEDNDRVIIFRLLPHELAADVFEYLDVDMQQELLRGMAHEQVVGVLNEMSPDDRTALLEELPSAAARQLIRLLTPEERRIAQVLLGYPEGSVGRRMTPDFIAVHGDWSIREVLDYVREHGEDSETLNVIYVVDDRGKLLDDIRIREILLQPLDSPVSELMDENFVSLSVTDREEDAVNVFRKYDRSALPVTDMNGVLVGIVTIDDMLDIAEEEATEDIHKAGAVTPLDAPLLKSRFTALYARRVTWLVLLVFVNVLSGAGIANFEALIESVVALVFFLPLLIASGGNAGSQASTIVIRAMALGEVKPQDYMKAMLQECTVSISLGLTMAAAVFLLAWWRSGLVIAQVVAISMVSIVFIGSLIGMSLPFILRRFKLDPAAASAPLVTSMADIIGVLTYLTIAQTLLRATDAA